MQNEEAQLRQQIKNLVGKEGVLEKKRTRLQEKVMQVKKKIAKVAKIREDLTEVE